MTAMPAASRRDQAIDILRGFALVTITINHLTGIVYQFFKSWTPFPTLSHYGFSSAAELFFLLSGYLVGAVYLRADRDSPIMPFARKMGARAGKLYVYNAALFLALLCLCALSPMLARLTFYRHFVEGGPIAIAQFALMYLQPYCLEILATYILFLLLAPAFAVPLVRWPIPTVAASIALYAYALHASWLMVPGGTPVGDWKWNFNPASWQFLFFGAMAAGRFRLLDRLKEAAKADWRWVAGLGVAFVLLTAFFLVQPYLVPNGLGWMVPNQSKVHAAPIRILHAAIVILFMLAALWRWPLLQANPVGRAFAAVGAASLQAFVASTVIAYVLGFAWVELKLGYLAYMLLSLVGALALIAFAIGRRSLAGRATTRPLVPQPA